MSEFSITSSTVVDPPWLNAKRVLVGQVPRTQGTPEVYVLIAEAGTPYRLVDLYADSEQLRCFSTSNHLVIIERATEAQRWA